MLIIVKLGSTYIYLLARCLCTKYMYIQITIGKNGLIYANEHSVLRS